MWAPYELTIHFTPFSANARQMGEDVFEASESSDSDLEISEGLHRDFEKSSQWGKSLQMLKKMGWKEGEGLGRKQKRNGSTA